MNIQPTKTIYLCMWSVNNCVLSLFIIFVIIGLRSEGMATNELSSQSMMASTNKPSSQSIINIITNSTGGKRYFTPTIREILFQKSFKEGPAGVFKKEQVRFSEYRNDFGIQIRDMEMIACGSGHSYSLDIEGGRIGIDFIDASFDVEDIANEDKTNNNLVDVWVSVWKYLTPASSATNVELSTVTNIIRKREDGYVPAKYRKKGTTNQWYYEK